MSESIEFDPVDWVSAGSIGQPGKRTFYVQARMGRRLVALLVEKGQVASLSRLAQELLDRVEVTVTPDDLDESRMRLRPDVEPLWRVGTMSLGMDEAGERFLLEAEELILDGDGEEDDELDSDDEDDDEVLQALAAFRDDDDVPRGAVARFWMDRPQVVAMAAYAAYAVEAGARERCRLCGRPIDPVAAHVCPSQNGHGPLGA